MNEVQKALYDSIVRPALNQLQHTVQATVIAYDNKSNTAVIDYRSPHSDGMTRLYGVNVQIGSGGVHSAGPFPGDEVVVNFVNSDAKNPLIVALVNSDYIDEVRDARLRHEQQGALLPFSLIKTIPEGINSPVSTTDTIPRRM